jgi:uncharacterized glyoxalase superfamily protein PhnB
MAVKPIPDGFRTITPYLVVKDAAKAIEFYKNAFGACEKCVSTDEHSGRIMNAQLTIGDSVFMLNDEFPEHGCLGPSKESPSPVTIHLYVEDVDRVFDQAVKAGAEVTMPVSDVFWGDRFGQVRDPFGHSWSIGTHKEDLTPAEIAERAKHAFA